MTGRGDWHTILFTEKSTIFSNIMYKAYWGLKEKPFQNTPDPRFVYLSAQHLEATALMIYAIKENKGAGMLTGEYGCGKTVISRLIFEILPKDIFDFAIVTNPQFNPTEMLKEICFQFSIRISASPSKNELLEALNDRFYVNLHTGKHTIIIIDEAQTVIDPLTFEEVRLLLNFQLNDRFLLTLLLFGQTELREKLKRFKQLNQRLALKYHIDALRKDDTEKYINYRLRIAGARRRIFTNESLNIIWDRSKGIPRVINAIADWCLLLGYSRFYDRIEEKTAIKAAADLGYTILDS
ncbi:MAG: AAA family ATPase [Candidatus Aminicenantes bacterium]|nr:AAA family ATPase [Candidatus Aminicenantes bacterium]